MVFLQKLDNLPYLCKQIKRIDLNLIIDIGNNSAKFFLFKEGKTILHTRKENTSFDTIGEWNKEFGIAKAIVSSVIAEPKGLEDELAKLTCPVIRFSSSTPLPLTIKYATPGTLGSDRLAAAIGAWSQAPNRNLLVIDAGTAITIDFVERNGNYHGGNIAPGIRMRLRALHEYTDKLPLVDKEGDTPTIGYDTETAIRSGVVCGVCHEINGYISEFLEKFGEVFVFLTGGDENHLKNRIKSCTFADKYLVAKGLNWILDNYDKN